MEKETKDTTRTAEKMAGSIKLSSFDLILGPIVNAKKENSTPGSQNKT